jgi:hypothetical protein
LRSFAADARAASGDVAGRPAIVAVDGRSGSGKSSIAQVLVDNVLASAVVHTDDVAWYQTFFGWDDVLVDDVLRPLLACEPVKPLWRGSSAQPSSRLDHRARARYVFSSGPLHVPGRRG